MARTAQLSETHLVGAGLGGPGARGLEELIRARQIAGDRITKGLGVVLAVSGIALPIYVFQTSGSRPDVPMVLPAFAGDIPTNRNFAVGHSKLASLDPASTGSVPGMDAKDAQDKEARAQSEKSKVDTDSKRYRVLGVSNGVALIEGPQGVWAVMSGAELPGAGRIEAIEKSGKGWVVTTSETVISQPAVSKP